MSGTSIPYHLRTNKAIDRDIFFELLGRLKLPETIQNYNYISLGGPMLEDLRLLHQRMNMNKLTSLEKDSAVLTRQEFNKPYSCISCKKSSTNEYINQLNPSSPSIIWLDYTKTNWSTQFQECHTLLSKLNVFDVIKISLNANPDSLDGKEATDKLQSFHKKADGPYTSNNIIENDVILMDKLALTLAGIIETVSQSALDLNEGLTLKLLTLF